MKTIILDTNFLIYCVKYKIDFFSEIDRICNFNYKLSVLSSTIDELEKLKPSNLNLIKKFVEKLEIINSNIYTDKKLIELSNKDMVIATQDNELKKRINGSVIIIRQKKYLELKN